MIKKTIGLMLAIALILCAAALPAAAVTGLRTGEPAETEEPSPAPTETVAPTETAAPEPTATPTPKPTTAPTNRPTASPTAKPTNTPSAATPAPTARPTGGTATPAPAVTTAPTQEPAYIAYPLWDRAAPSIAYTNTVESMQITLVEGLSEYIEFSDFYGNLPATVIFRNEFDTLGRCSIEGYFSVPGTYEFAIEFTIRGGRKLLLNFAVTAVDENAPTAQPNAFPEAHPLVPFGAAPSAMAPAARRKEDA